MSTGPSSSSDVRDRRLDVARLGDVAGQREHVVRCLGGEIEGRDVRALVAETARDRLADAARPARDERHPSRESIRVAHGSNPSLESEPRGLRSDQRLPARDAASRPRVDTRRHPARGRHPGCSEGGRARRRRDARHARDASDAGGGRARGGAARSSPRASSAPRSSPRYPTICSSRSTRHFVRAARPHSSWRSGPRASMCTRRRRRLPSCARLPRRTRRGGCSRMSSRRFSSRATRDLHLEQLVSPLPELGLVAANGPNDPEPELVVEDGVVTRMDGREAADFDVIDRFVVAHGLDLDVAGEAMALDDLDLARRLVDVNVSRGRAHPAVAGPHAGEARARHRPARPGRADAGAEEAPRAASSGQSGARDESQGEPGASRRRCGRGRATRLRRDGDDGRRRAVRAAERDRSPRRLADRPTRCHDAVRGRGAAKPRARDSRSRHLRRDALRLRHRARLRRRRRHAVVEGVPRCGLRVARREGALHLGHRLGGTDGIRAGPLDALSRGALPRRRARRGLAGRAERLDLVRCARPVRAGRHARDPRRERARRLARPRGRVRKRRDRVALGDPKDGEAHGSVPPWDGLRDLGLLRDAAARQHVRRRQLRRRRPRRVADDPARLAGGCRDRARLRGRAAARAGAGGTRRAGRVRRPRAAADLGRRGRRRDDRLRRPRDAGPRPCCRRRGGRRAPRARCVGSRRRACARSPRVRRRRRGRARHAAPARLGGLPADLGGHRSRRRRALGGQRSERVLRAGNRLPARGGALGAPAVAAASGRAGGAPRRVVRCRADRVRRRRRRPR